MPCIDNATCLFAAHVVWFFSVWLIDWEWFGRSLGRVLEPWGGYSACVSVMHVLEVAAWIGISVSAPDEGREGRNQ